MACGDDDDGFDGPPIIDMDAGMDAGMDAAVDAGADAGPRPDEDAGAEPDEDAGDGANREDGELPERLVEIIATDFDFNPERIHALPGETLIISLRNEGTVPHNILFDLEDEDPVLDSNVPPQQTAQMTVTVPEEPGEYVFWCPIGNHRELGMEGTLVVEQPRAVRLEPAASGMVSPIGMAVAPDDSQRRFIIDQVGLIRVLGPDGELQDEPFLDLRDRIVELRPDGDERGLLGLAFHPEYADNGRFFVYYSAPLRPEAPDDWDHTSRISEFRVLPDDGSRADPDSERILLAVDQPQSNHNAGTLAFGPQDGYLYISLGDGGGAADNDMGHTPGLGNGQDVSKLLGSILRIDVDGAQPYAIPEDNPFVGGEGEDEIFAYGFRNPYRFSFDMAGEHVLLVGDAGQALWEEVSAVTRGGNYGWRILEGTHCFDVDDFEDPPATCAETGPRGESLTWPVIEIPNAKQRGGIALTVIGGYVYRGDDLGDDLVGKYVFGSLSRSEEQPSALLLVAEDTDGEGDDLWAVQRLAPADGSSVFVDHFLKGFGQDAEGELYVLVSDRLGPNGETGQVLKLQPAADD